MLAVGIAIGGYCLLLAWRRPDIAVAADRAPEAPPAPLAAPQRLPTAPDFDRVALAASSRRTTPTVRLTVRVHGIAPEWRAASPAAGLSVMPVDGSSGPRWLPLTHASGTPSEAVLSATLAGTGELQLALAAGPGLAMHGYLARRTVTAADGAILELDARAARVEFQLRGEALRRGPYRIVRSTDPRWLPQELAGGSLALAPGTTGSVWLGLGEYALCDPMAPDRRQPFVVPTPSPIELSAELTGVRASRP